MPNERIITEVLDQGYQAFQEQDWHRARDLITEALRLTGGKAELFGVLGITTFHLGDYSASCGAFQSAIEIDPANVDIHIQLAMAHIEMGEQAKAEEALRRAVSLDPDRAAALRLLAGCCDAAGRADDASEYRTRAEAAESKRPPTKSIPGTIVQSQSQPASKLDRDILRTNLVPVASAADRRRAEASIQKFYDEAKSFFADVVPPELSDRHLRNSRIVPNRNYLLTLLPKGGVCAEIGTQTGWFAKRILQQMTPSEFHIIDMDFTPFDLPYFSKFIESGVVRLYQGDSSALLEKFPDKHFDFIYVDGDHGYEGVSRDLKQAARKIKDDGWIVCNDYTVFSPLENMRYGVARAVNELCINGGFEIVYLALQKWSYHDVAIRKVGGSR